MRRRLLALISRMYRRWLSSGSQISSLGDGSMTSSEGDYAEGSGQDPDCCSQRDDGHGLMRVWERSQRAAAPESLQNGRDEGLAKWEEYKRQACAGVDMLPRAGLPSHPLIVDSCSCNRQCVVYLQSREYSTLLCSYLSRQKARGCMQAWRFAGCRLLVMLECVLCYI